MANRVMIGIALFVGLGLLIIMGSELVFTVSVIVVFGWASLSFSRKIKKSVS